MSLETEAKQWLALKVKNKENIFTTTTTTNNKKHPTLMS